jgi:hypothetical protein
MVDRAKAEAHKRSCWLEVLIHVARELGAGARDDAGQRHCGVPGGINPSLRDLLGTTNEGVAVLVPRGRQVMLRASSGRGLLTDLKALEVEAESEVPARASGSRRAGRHSVRPDGDLYSGGRTSLSDGVLSPGLCVTGFCPKTVGWT